MKSIDDQVMDLKPDYKHRQEEQIGYILDQYGIPFVYKQPTIVMDPQTKQNEIWAPSFSLPQYGNGIIDYVDSSNPSQLENKLEIYQYNQIPATVLGPEDLDKSNFQAYLYEKRILRMVTPFESFDYIINK